jgi:hypothetical protein
LALTSLSYVICLSVCPLDHGETIAARTACMPLATPLPKEETRIAPNLRSPS